MTDPSDFKSANFRRTRWRNVLLARMLLFVTTIALSSSDECAEARLGIPQSFNQSGILAMERLPERGERELHAKSKSSKAGSKSSSAKGSKSKSSKSIKSGKVKSGKGESGKSKSGKSKSEKSKSEKSKSEKSKSEKSKSGKSKSGKSKSGKSKSGKSTKSAEEEGVRPAHDDEGEQQDVAPPSEDDELHVEAQNLPEQSGEATTRSAFAGDGTNTNENAFAEEVEGEGSTASETTAASSDEGIESDDEDNELTNVEIDTMGEIAEEKMEDISNTRAEIPAPSSDMTEDVGVDEDEPKFDDVIIDLDDENVLENEAGDEVVLDPSIESVE